LKISISHGVATLASEPDTMLSVGLGVGLGVGLNVDLGVGLGDVKMFG